MGKFMETDSRLVVATAGEEETQRVIANGYRILSGVMKYFIIS